MTTRASLNGTGAAEMEFEAAHYSNPEMEEEWEAHEGSPYSSPEMEEEWETHEGSHYSNPYSNPEMEEEWETHETPEGSHYSNPYSNPEMEWEMHEGNPYSNPEMEWETQEGSHYSNPYSSPEMEWEAQEGSHYSNPYSNPEFEEEWETHEGSHYSNPEMEWEMHEGSHYSNPEWETQEGSHYSNPYSNPSSNPEWEDESDRFFPLVAKAATNLLPHAVRIGRNLIRGERRRPAPGRSTGRSRPMGPRNQQISGLFHQLGRIFAQGESEAAAQEAHLFGANEFETEVATNEAGHEAALTEVMAAEASHTESEGEAEALLGAALPISMKVMGGRIGIRRLTPTLLRVNAQLVLNLHRQGAPGRQLLRVMPSVQRRTVSTLGAIERTGQQITPAVAANVMKGQAARVLTKPHICRQALTRNMIVRQQTVAPGGPTAPSTTGPQGRPGSRPGPRPGTRIPGGRTSRPGMYRPGRPGMRPGMRVPGRPGVRPSMSAPMGMRGPAGMRVPGGPARMRSPIAGRPVSRPHPTPQGRPAARPQHSMPGRTVPGPRRHLWA